MLDAPHGSDRRSELVDVIHRVRNRWRLKLALRGAVIVVAGTLLALIGASFGVALFLLRLRYGSDWAAQGVFTIFAVLFVFLGVQLVGMGLLGEYIGRISRDVQARPRYLVREVVGGVASSASSDFRDVRRLPDRRAL